MFEKYYSNILLLVQLSFGEHTNYQKEEEEEEFNEAWYAQVSTQTESNELAVHLWCKYNICFNKC